MDALLIKEKESHLHDCQNNGFRGRNAFRDLSREYADIVPGLAQECATIDIYYGEVNRGIGQLLSDISRVYSQAYATEYDFVIALDRERRQARYLLQALKGLNRLVDPRPISGGRSLMQLSPQRFNYHAAKIEVALAGKAFESMVVRDDRGNIVGYRWDIIENILNKDAVNISEAEYAALAMAFLNMDNLSDKERFLNALVDKFNTSSGVSMSQDMIRALESGSYIFTLCPDKVAGILKYVDSALFVTLNPNFLQHSELLRGLVSMTEQTEKFDGFSSQLLFKGGAAGPIQLSPTTEGGFLLSAQGVTLTEFGPGQQFVLSDTQVRTLDISGVGAGGVANTKAVEGKMDLLLGNLPERNLGVQITDHSIGIMASLISKIPGAVGSFVSGAQLVADVISAPVQIANAQNELTQRQQEIIAQGTVSQLGTFYERLRTESVVTTDDQGGLNIRSIPTEETLRHLETLNENAGTNITPEEFALDSRPAFAAWLSLSHRKRYDLFASEQSQEQ